MREVCAKYVYWNVEQILVRLTLDRQIDIDTTEMTLAGTKVRRRTIFT